MNELPKVNAQSKFHIRMQLNPHPKRLSLSQKPKRKSPPKKFKTLALPGITPGIGQLFVMDLIKSDSQSKEAQTKASEQTEFQIAQEKRRASSVNQHKIRDKQIFISKKNVRLSLGQTNNLNKKTLQFCANLLKDNNLLKEKQKLINQNEIKENQIQTKFQEKKSSMIREQQKKKIQTKDEIVQTNQIEKTHQSYEEFVKFKITENLTYKKMMNLFGYVEHASKLQQQNRNSNFEQFRSIFNNKIESQREKRVQDLMKDLLESAESFTSLFKQIFIRQAKICRDFLKNQQNFNQSTKESLKEVETRILQLMTQKELSGQTITPKEVKEAFDETLGKLDPLLEQNKQIISLKMNQCYKNEREIEERYAQWQCNISEQSRLIKNCVLSIMELPQLSMGLFGFEQLADHNQVNKDIKRYCLNGKEVPNITDFFARKGRPDEKEINEAFRKCCEVKCMNCIYIRSKIKFIYDKNKELKPVVKVLMQLVKNDQKQAELHRRLSRCG